MAALNFLEEYQISAGGADCFAQFRQDEATVQGSEAFVRIDRQYAQAMDVR
jgi:hypothetical protein